jgi:hypothetical protein
MAGTLTKLLRLASARGPLVLVRAAWGAVGDACRTPCLRIAAAPLPECGYRLVWSRPTQRRLELALRKRLGITLPDFRRRAESVAGLDALPPDTPVTGTVLLAGRRAFDDPRVRTFLLARATEGALHLARPGEDSLPRPGALTLLAGIEADADGQARLLGLRRRGIACDWLAAADDTDPEEVPLRETCQRQAVPVGRDLAYTPIAVPQPLIPPPVRPTCPRSLRVLTYRWHVPHQYELFKLGAEFTLVSDLGEDACRWWDLGQRPLPANARFARWSEIDPGSFDLAILHFDENVLRAAADAPGVGAGWGASFRFLRQRLAIPCVAVCHGTPQAGAPAQREALAGLLSDTPVVVNSHQAQAEWGFRNARTIWQGFDPAQFPCRPGPGRHAPRILTLPGEAFTERPGYRGAGLLEAVAARMAAPLERLRVPEPNLLLSGNAYAKARFGQYIAALHGFDIYFNPTLRSPMPRSRGEAMLCGLATVNANSHDVDRFIENGVNGFYAETAEELADQLSFLLADPARTWRIGQAGRETAVRLFHTDRYLDDWRRLIREVLGSDAI